MFKAIGLIAVIAAYSSLADPSGQGSPKAPAASATAESGKLAERAEQLRLRCIEARRYVAGRVLEVLPEGLVVDSGYSKLLSPPLNKSWLASGTVSVARDATAVEENKPDAVCVGVVLLSNYPKKPAVKAFDYVVMHAYPAGDYVYTPAAGIRKTVRRFSASLARAVDMNLERESK